MMADRSLSKFNQVSDALWERIDLVLLIYKTSRQGGRPRLSLRKVVNGILYVLRTGCPWKAMPREFGSGRAIHAYPRVGSARHVRGTVAAGPGRT